MATAPAARLTGSFRAASTMHSSFCRRARTRPTSFPSTPSGITTTMLHLELDPAKLKHPDQRLGARPSRRSLGGHLIPRRRGLERGDHAASAMSPIHREMQEIVAAGKDVRDTPRLLEPDARRSSSAGRAGATISASPASRRWKPTSNTAAGSSRACASAASCGTASPAPFHRLRIKHRKPARRCTIPPSATSASRSPRTASSSAISAASTAPQSRRR